MFRTSGSKSLPTRKPLVEPMEARVMMSASAATGNGLLGQYFDGTNFQTPEFERVDAMVSFNWGDGGPTNSGGDVGANTFSIRWTGSVQPKYSETYTFFTKTDDGVRLWVDGKLIIDQWKLQAAKECSGSIDLKAGVKYSIKMEYFENTGKAVAKLMWGSASQFKQTIPRSSLFSGDIQPAPSPTPTPTPPPPTEPPPPVPEPTPTGGPTPPPIAGTWNSIYADEFSGPVQWDSRYDETLWGLHGYSDENEYYARSNATASNGALHLTATKQAQGGWDYTSGQISSGGKWGSGGHDNPGFAFKYGYIEANMKLSQGNLWPAFWLIGTGTSDEEIDIMEYVGEKGYWYATLHNGPQQGHGVSTGQDLDSGFHRYGIDWEADHIAWYFDGNEVFRVTNNVPQNPHFFILNLAVGGNQSWPGVPTSNTLFPNSFDVDYVRVWQKA